MPWEVVLTNPGRVYSIYASDYFPRKFAYKREALQCVKAVADLDGEAYCLKTPVKDISDAKV